MPIFVERPEEIAHQNKLARQARPHLWKGRVHEAVCVLSYLIGARNTHLPRHHAAKAFREYGTAVRIVDPMQSDDPLDGAPYFSSTAARVYYSAFNGKMRISERFGFLCLD